MTPKSKTIDSTSYQFTVKTLPKIKVEPDYEAINKMMKMMYAIVTNLLVPQGGGYHGHIVIITKPTLYTTFSTTMWGDPLDPGV